MIETPKDKELLAVKSIKCGPSSISSDAPSGFLLESSPTLGFPRAVAGNISEATPIGIQGSFPEADLGSFSDSSKSMSVKFIDGGSAMSGIPNLDTGALARIAIKYPGDASYRSCVFSWEPGNQLTLASLATVDGSFPYGTYTLSEEDKCIVRDGGDGYLYIIGMYTISGSKRILVHRYSQAESTQVAYSKYAYSDLFSSISISNATDFDVVVKDSIIYIAVASKYPADISIFRLPIRDYSPYGLIELISRDVYSFNQSETIDSGVSISYFNDYMFVAAGVSRSATNGFSNIERYLISASTRDIRNWSSSNELSRSGVFAGFSTQYRTPDRFSESRLIATHIMPDTGFGVAVGTGGLILTTTDFGVTWGTVPDGSFAGRNRVDLFSCRCIKNTFSDKGQYTIYIGGAYGFLARSTDSGNTWKNIFHPDDIAIDVKIDGSGAFSFTNNSDHKYTIINSDFELYDGQKVENVAIAGRSPQENPQEDIISIESVSQSSLAGSESTLFVITKYRVFRLDKAEIIEKLDRGGQWSEVAAFSSFIETKVYYPGGGSAASWDSREFTLSASGPQGGSITSACIINDDYASPELLIGGDFSKLPRPMDGDADLKDGVGFVRIPLFCRISGRVNISRESNFTKEAGYNFSYDSIPVSVQEQQEYPAIKSVSYPTGISPVNKDVAYAVLRNGTYLKWERSKSPTTAGGIVLINRDYASKVRVFDIDFQNNGFHIAIARSDQLPLSSRGLGIKYIYIVRGETVFYSVDGGGTWTELVIEGLSSGRERKNISVIYNQEKSIDKVIIVKRNSIYSLSSTSRCSPILRHSIKSDTMYLGCQNHTSKKYELYSVISGEDLSGSYFSLTSNPDNLSLVGTSDVSYDPGDVVDLSVIDNDNIVIYRKDSSLVSYDGGFTWQTGDSSTIKAITPVRYATSGTKFSIAQYNGSRLICMYKASTGYSLLSSRHWATLDQGPIPGVFSDSPGFDKIWTGVGDSHILITGSAYSGDQFDIPIEYLYDKSFINIDTPSIKWATGSTISAIGKRLELLWDRNSEYSKGILGGPGSWIANACGVIGANVPFLKWAIAVPDWNNDYFPTDPEMFTEFNMTSIVHTGYISKNNIKNGYIKDASITLEENKFVNSSARFYLMVATTDNGIGDAATVEIRTISGNTENTIFYEGSAISPVSDYCEYAIYSDRMFNDGTGGMRSADVANFPVEDITGTEYEFSRMVRLTIPKIYKTPGDSVEIGAALFCRKIKNNYIADYIEDEYSPIGSDAKWQSAILYLDEQTPSGIYLSARTSNPKMVFELPYSLASAKQVNTLHNMLAPNLRQPFIFLLDSSNSSSVRLVYARDGVSAQNVGGGLVNYSLVLEEIL